MRKAVAVLAAMLFAPLAQGVVLEDPEGDVDVQVMGQQTTPVPAGVRDGIDIVALDVEEDAAGFRFILEVKSIDDMFSDALEDKEILVDFSHGQIDYQIRHQALLPGDDRARLTSKHSSDTYYDWLHEIPIEVDRAANTITYTVDRYEVPDERGAPPTKGAVLKDVRVRTSAPVVVALLSTGLYGAVVANVVYGEPYIWILRDYAGHGEPGSYAVEFGVEQTGTGRLRADEPYRTSNGEAGTFVYWVEASHNGTGTGRYGLDVEGVPAGWAVQVPPGTLQTSEGAPLELPVIVQTAFAHSHGATEEFTLLLKSQDGGAGKLVMGIRYPEIPQPSGHHSTLYFHSGPGTDVLDNAFEPLHEPVFGNTGAEAAYMNALEEDENDLGSPVDFRNCGGGIDTTRFCLQIPLEPRLQMGLDLRLGEIGTLHVPLDSSAGGMTGVLEGYIQHFVREPYELCPTCGTYYREQAYTLASIAPSAPVDLGSSATPVEVTAHPTRYADYVPYDPTAGLRLVLNFTADRPTLIADQLVPGIEPRLSPGGFMSLPFNEYRDRVDQIPSLGQDLVWKVDQRERLANPGSVILYNATLTNNGDGDEFTLRIVGHNRDWAELGRSDVVKLRPNQTVPVPVIVRVPAGTAVDATAELVMEAASTSDVARRSLLQVRTQVTDEPVEDDALAVDGLQAGDKKSPGSGLLLAPLLLAALALRRRR